MQIPVAVVAPVASAFVQLADSTMGADAASFDFQAIPQTYNHLLLLFMGRTAEAAFNSDLAVRFNNDSGSNYVREYIRGDLDTAEANHSATTTSIISLSVAGDSGVAGVCGSGSLFIPAYTQTTFHKVLHGSSGHYSATGSAQAMAVLYNGRWSNTAAITRVTLFVQSASNFRAGSRATLYGML